MRQWSEWNRTDRLLEKTHLVPPEGKSKVTTLAGAIERYIRPGQAIQFGEKPAFPTGYPMALLNEVVRRYYGKNPAFTYISYGGYANTLAPMIAGKMIKKIITTFLGDPYPHPSPNRVFQNAFSEKSVVIENWTMLSLTLRLMAGAAGLPFLPTRSLAGSSMEADNPDFALITEPFGQERIGLVRALRPDICLIHGWVADEAGNTVLNCPWGGNVYGALGAREGVIVSVEKIVSMQEMKQYREHVRIPGHVVRAVAEAPFGSHPSGHNGFPHNEAAGYLEDEPFILEARNACRDEKALKRWTEKWILDCPDHERYLEKLGSERFFSLQGKIRPSGWKLCTMDAETEPAAPASPEEEMIVMAARFLEQTIESEGFDFVLTGVGASHIASWLAYYKVMEKGGRVRLMTESGLYGYEPLPGDPFLFANRNIPTADMYTDIFHILGCMVQGSAGRCLGVLGAGQVDCRGNINSTQIPEANTYLVGSGGGNDVASGADEVVVVAMQDKRRFMEAVSWITSPGDRVAALVSQHGVFKKDDTGVFRLTAYMERPGVSVKETIEAISSACGWNLKTAANPAAILPPTAGELAQLRRFDPKRYFLGKQVAAGKTG